jgi:hypothetical protein
LACFATDIRVTWRLRVGPRESGPLRRPGRFFGDFPRDMVSGTLAANQVRRHGGFTAAARAA